MHGLIALIVSPYQRALRVYVATKADNPPRAELRFIYLPFALFAALASVSLFTGISLLWVIALLALYMPFFWATIVK